MVSKNAPEKVTQRADVAVRTELPLDVVQSFRTPEDIQNYFASQGFVLSFGEEISDGYERLENKERLVSQPFIIIDWNVFWSEEYQNEAVTIRLMTNTGEKFRIADGSTGIKAQLDEVTKVRQGQTDKLPNAGLVVKEGLTKSEYWVSKADGRAMSQREAEETPAELKRKATTYYLSL